MERLLYTQRYLRFRQLITQARKDANITQAELAERLKRPQSYVSKYENGERRIDLVEFLEIAHELDIDISLLINGILTIE